MVWSNPTAALTAFRAMLVACPSAVSAGLSESRVHYPYAVGESDDATAADAMPRAILAEMNRSRVRYAEMGVLGLPTGRITVRLDADTDVGSLETLAGAILSELTSQSTGLPLRAVDAPELCSDVTPGRRAADETTGDTAASFRSILITLDYGLTA